jgi:hypothetical protein
VWLRLAEFLELPLGPLNWSPDQHRGGPVEAVVALVELRAERPQRAAIARGQLALVRQRADERLEAGPRSAVSLEAGEHRLDVRKVPRDGCGDQVRLSNGRSSPNTPRSASIPVCWTPTNYR